MTRNLLAIAMLAAPIAAIAADAIDPGLYQVVTKTSVGSTETKNQCFTAADITRGFQSSDMGKDCKVARAVVSGGKIDYLTTCPDMTMTTKGSYTSTSYAIDGKVQIKSDGETMDIETHIVGKKIAATCKP